jgi:acetyl-CoA carboxylase carboxyltransferase component
MMESALKCGTPFVFINDSGGARVQEGIDSLSGYGQVFYSNVKLSGPSRRSRSFRAPAPVARPTARR